MINPDKVTELTDSIGNFATIIKALFSSSISTRTYKNNDIMGLSSDGAPIGVSAVVSDYTIVTAADSIGQAQGVTEDFRKVFNEWPRIANGDRQFAETVRADLEGWRFDYVKHQIASTIESATVSGFVQDENVGTDYVYEVEVSADTAGNGGIGIIIAFNEGSGTSNFLSVIRHLGGLGTSPKFGLYLNAVDPADLPTPLVSIDAPLAAGNWGDTGAPVKIKVVCAGNKLTLSTGNPGAGYLSAADLTFNMTSANTAGLNTNRRFGYCAVKQSGAHFSLLRKVTKKQKIMDMVNNRVYNYVSQGWSVESGKTPADYLLKNRLYFSPGTQRLVYVDYAGGASIVQGT